MEYKSLPLLSKDIGEDRVVRSIFSVMGNIDDGGDRIWPGAFAKTIQERVSRIKVLWQHDSYAPPIGVPLSMEEIGRSDLPADLKEQYPDATGALLASVRYLDTPRGDEVLTGIKVGAINENSIGYDAVKFDFEEIAGDGMGGMVRNLREVRLWDVSPVNWGMNSATVNIKSFGDPRLASLATAIELLLAPGALKAGRVLSSRNLEKLQSALAALQEVLSAAEPPTDEDDAGKALTVLGLMSRLAIAEREMALIGG